MKKNLLTVVFGVLSLVAVLAFSGCEKKAEADVTPEAEIEPAEGLVGIANPWMDVTADELAKELGFTFTEPEGATDVFYSYNSASGLGQMNFMLNGAEWTARAKKTEALEDISGVYYEWADPENCGYPEELALGNGVSGEYHVEKTEEGYVSLGLWYNEGYSMSLSGSGAEYVEMPAAEVFVLD